MRCPHCATAVAAPPVCHVCGSKLEEPAARQDTVPGLEPTSTEPVDADGEPIPDFEPSHVAHVEVEVVPMPDLVTNEDALGDTSIPEEQADLTDPTPTSCQRCGAPYRGGRFCEQCGRVVVGGTSSSVAKNSNMVVCLECSVPNPKGRERCMTCGGRL